MAVLPTGTVTFLFTDVEGSTRLWEEHPGAMRTALARHVHLIEETVARLSGRVVRPRGEGDSRFCVFARAAAQRLQRQEPGRGAQFS
jgi:class 3 adenylate cyclase